jgi:endonuclease/exonuclease/phosphatase family metal-dependent hydrolase
MMQVSKNTDRPQPEIDPPPVRDLSVATWNMDHWKRTVQARRDAWSYLASGLHPDVALLQECVAPRDLSRSKIVHRQIAGSRSWGSAVAAFNDEMDIEEIGAVRTKYSSTLFPMLGTYPGATIVARVTVPGVGPITCVSVYGLINVYAQTTMLRIIADLIPLFDSPDGERVVLGGDMNVTTAMSPSTPELRRYEAILKAVESLGLQNLAETAAERPPPLENCLCGASSCHHLRTYGNNPGSQLDWIFATPELARRCRRLRVDYEKVGSLSDHAPIIADFQIPLGIPDREWDPDSFVQELGIRHGSDVSQVADEVIAWAERKHAQMRYQHPYAALDRLPVSTGPDPELWVQLDLKHPEALGYTISMTADGLIKLQFQYMSAPPYDTVEARKNMYDAVSALPGVSVEERLTGRPSFPIAALAAGDNLERLIKILEHAVDKMVENHKRSSA